MEKVREYAGHAVAFQALAKTALSDTFKLEYLKLAAAWMDIAEERRAFLVGSGRDKPQ